MDFSSPVEHLKGYLRHLTQPVGLRMYTGKNPIDFLHQYILNNGNKIINKQKIPFRVAAAIEIYIFTFHGTTNYMIQKSLMLSCFPKFVIDLRWQKSSKTNA